MLEWNPGVVVFHYCSENWQKSNPFFSLNQFTIGYDIDNSLKVETRPNNISCMDGLYSKRNGCGIIENEWDIHFVRVVWQMMFEICGSKFGKVCPIREERRKCHTEVVIVAPVIWQLIITAHFLEIQSPLVYTLLYSFMNRLVVLCRHDDCLARSNVWCGRISRAWRISHATTTAARLTENWLDEELSRTNNTKKPFSGYILYFTHIQWKYHKIFLRN